MTSCGTLLHKMSLTVTTAGGEFVTEDAAAVNQAATSARHAADIFRRKVWLMDNEVLAFKPSIPENVWKLVFPHSLFPNGLLPSDNFLMQDFVGSVERLAWAKAMGCPWTIRICAELAGNGNLRVLKWARAQDPPCPWDEFTCAIAAYTGHLELLKWARAQTPPCPWNGKTVRAANAGGFRETVIWLLNNMREE